MRMLLSNKDSIHVLRIQQMAVTLCRLSTVQIVAPDRDRSGTSNSLTLRTPLRTQTQPNSNIAILSGMPTDCIYLGVNPLPLMHLNPDIVRPSLDILVSSINARLNLAHDVIYYSSTVVTAMEERHLVYLVLVASLDGSRHADSKVTHQTNSRGREMPRIGPTAGSFDEGAGTDFEIVSQIYVSLTALQVDPSTNGAAHAGRLSRRY